MIEIHSTYAREKIFHFLEFLFILIPVGGARKVRQGRWGKETAVRNRHTQTCITYHIKFFVPQKEHQLFDIVIYLCKQHIASFIIQTRIKVQNIST